MTERKLQVIPLGGLGEFGMNCTAVRAGAVVGSGMILPVTEFGEPL